MNDDFIRYPTDNQIGFIRAYEGDGLVMDRPFKARGTVQSQKIPTMCCTRGGGCGVVVRWPNGSSKDGTVTADIYDGLKIHPNPAMPNSGGTVQKQSSNSLNTYKGCGSGVVTTELRIRYLTPRECLRLMGQHDDDIDNLIAEVPSKNQLYRLAGNSIVVNVLEAIFRGIYLENSFSDPEPKQVSLNDFLKERPAKSKGVKQ